ncbi:TATA box-binding protein-associated factor RNA polymerase I subunit C [Phytophthora cinnamomi]|uniref:TATA box-binding protein-associated factor RNA polymerase I subunit C n=1 Tax=Phytophthora cinnamomi TaxID=4785 RepID=UPI003559A972|nr:TATA box-binding protein-associated factor RNA polymerase I subunit C [Phytophthora cinnamomi]
MDAARVYPNTVPVLAANGLGGAIAGNDPDQVPLEPGLINDARRRFAPDGRAVDATGVMRLHVRNALGYAFLRPHHRDKLQKLLINSKWQKIDIAKAESAFYRRNYRDFVPQDLMMDFILNDNPLQEDSSKVSKWQGNAISGVDCGQDGHVVFYPTGHVLQQACAWYSKGESEDATPCSSTVIETGARIRQFEVMGSRDAYRSASAAKIYAAARGTTNCTIVAAPSRVTPQNVRKMQAKAKISFPGMINHIAGSPHAEAELAIVMNGVVHCWDPEGGARNVNKDFMNMADRVLRCEYSRYELELGFDDARQEF